MAFYKVDSDTAELTKVSGGTLYADAPVGTIFEYGGTTAPSGYGLCKHQAVSRTEYAELFGRIGTTYGSGDGSTTFNLPDKTQLKQDYTVKTLLDTWSNNLEDGSESHTFTASADGDYYFEIVLSNASAGKAGNNVSLTEENKLISTWGYVGTGAVLFNKTVFLKAGTYVLTHICQTAGIGGSSTVTVYSTRNEPVGSYIIKMKHTPVPADFMDAVDDVIKDTTVDAVANGDMNPVTSNAVYDEFKRVQPQTYECYGYLINSIAGEIEGYGRATVTLKDGVAEIKFSARIHTNTMSSTFRWGLNRDLLRTLLPNLPYITPIGNYSNLQFFAGTGAVLVDLMGYGAMASADNQFWVPARMYQINGSTGVWGSDQFPTNSYITGTVYGIYTV